MYSEKTDTMETSTMQTMIEEMQAEIKRLKELLEAKDREIEELEKLCGGNPGASGAGSQARPGIYNENDSLERIYQVISSLDKYTTEEVLFYAVQVLSRLMGTPDVAIYNVANRDYARLFSATSATARRLGNSIKYTDMGELYEALKNEQVYLNSSMDERFPLMASAVYDEDRIRLILMFWGIPEQRLTLAESHRLTAIGTLIQNAVLRASRYLGSFRRKRYLEGTNVLNEGAFTILVKAFLEAKAKGLTECALLEVMLGYQGYEEVSTTLACNIRLTDYMGLLDNGKLYVLLCNTDSKNAEVVQERLQSLGHDCRIEDTEKYIGRLNG